MSVPAMASDRRPAASADEPWLGLESYREDDHAVFCGREKETELLRRMVHREVLTVVFGPSGIGKTSLLRAGLFRSLAAENFLPVYLRPVFDPTAPPPCQQAREQITKALRDRKVDEEFTRPMTDEMESLWEYLHSVELWNKRNEIVTPVLFFDQFEEVFTLGQGTKAAVALLDELSDIVENYIPGSVRERLDRAGTAPPPQFSEHHYKVVITLREDFIHRLDGLRKDMPSVMHNRYPLAQMDGGQALQAVRGPGGHLVNDEVAARIVRLVAASRAAESDHDLADQSIPLEELRVEPALLSVVCRELNSRRLRLQKPEITPDQLTEAQASVLDDFYDRSFENLPLAARVFVEERLLTSSGFRSTAPLEDAERAGLNQSSVRALVDRRLIRVEQRFGIPHIELTHDLLTRVVQSHRAARRADEAHAAEKAAAEDRERKRRAELLNARRIQLFFGACFFVTLIFAIAAGYYYFTANNIRREADQRHLIASANSNLIDDPETSVLLAIYAFAASRGGNTGMDREAAQSLHEALLSSRLEKHQDTDYKVTSVAFSPDGKYLATGDEGDFVNLWLLDGTWSKRTLSGHAADVRCLAFSPDGRFLASGGDDSMAFVWNVADGSKTATLPHTAKVRSIAVSADGQIVATGSEDNMARLWNLETGRHAELPGHSGIVRGLAFSPNGKLLATASDDSTVKLWDANSQILVRTLTGHKAKALTVAFSPTLDLLASGSEDRNVIVWDLPSGRPLQTIGGHDGSVVSVAFSPDGSLLASTSSDLTARLSAPLSGRHVASLRGHAATVRGVSFSPDGQRIATVANDKTIRLWTTASGGELLSRGSGQAKQRPMALSPDGKLFALGNAGKLELWDVKSGTRRTALLSHEPKVRSVAWSADSARVATAGDDQTVRIWDLRGLQLASLRHEKQISVVAFDPGNPRRVATGAEGGQVVLWDLGGPNLEGPKEVQRWNRGRDVTGLAFDPNCNGCLISVCTDGVVVLHNPASPVLSQAFYRDRLVTSIGLAPGGQFYVAGARDYRVRMWTEARPWSMAAIPPGVQLDCKKEGSPRDLIGHVAPVTSLAVSKRPTIVTGGEDKAVKLWDSRGCELLSLHGHTDVVAAVAISDDGKRVASAAADGTVQVYSVDPSELLEVARRRAGGYRGLTPSECEKYFHKACPQLPDKFAAGPGLW